MSIRRVAAGLLWVIGSVCAPAAAQGTWRVSVDSSGAQGNDQSYASSLSRKGRFVAFQSQASNLVAGDTNATWDAFVHDRKRGGTTRVSVDSSGAQGNDASFEPSMSGDGRFVAFYSDASNLVPGDTNRESDVFLHDLQTGAVTRVSVDSSGTQGNGSSGGSSLSADGRFVAFSSDAKNLVQGDTNQWIDVFVHDLESGATTRVSVDSSGVQGNADSTRASISANGGFVSFASDASNLVPGDTNGSSDVFVHDQKTGTTTRVSVRSSGRQGNAGSDHSSISADGRFVALDSNATNLVSGDTNGTLDVFVHDLQTGTTTRMSVASSNVQGDGASYKPSISENGRFVAFESYATNLAPGDTNGFLDVFVHDSQTGTTTRRSVSSSAEQGDCWSSYASMSGDGRFVGFFGCASNLVPADTNATFDVFVGRVRGRR